MFELVLRVLVISQSAVMLPASRVSVCVVPATVRFTSTEILEVLICDVFMSGTSISVSTLIVLAFRVDVFIVGATMVVDAVISIACNDDVLMSSADILGI